MVGRVTFAHGKRVGVSDPALSAVSNMFSHYFPKNSIDVTATS